MGIGWNQAAGEYGGFSVCPTFESDVPYRLIAANLKPRCSCITIIDDMGKLIFVTITLLSIKKASIKRLFIRGLMLLSSVLNSNFFIAEFLTEPQQNIFNIIEKYPLLAFS